MIIKWQNMYNMQRPCTYIQNENVQKSSPSFYFPFFSRAPEGLEVWWRLMPNDFTHFLEKSKEIFRVKWIIKGNYRFFQNFIWTFLPPRTYTVRRPFSRYCCVHFDDKFWDFSGHIYDSINQGLPKNEKKGTVKKSR
jgi:hypothetical protein